MTLGEKNIAQQIKAIIHAYNATAEVILFGSRARGTANKNSDWDVMILLNKPTVKRSEESVYRDLLFDLELEVGSPISAFVFSKQEWEKKHHVTPLYRNIQREGIYL